MNKITPGLDKWFSTVKIIHSFCDPVKRLQSEFVHVTSSHDRNWTIDAQFIGKSSQLYPFSNLTFTEFVNKYIPDILKLPKRISDMFTVVCFRIFC